MKNNKHVFLHQKTERERTDGIRIDRVSFPIGERVLCGTCRGLVPPGIRRHTWSINSNWL